MTEEGLRVGASVPLSTLLGVLREQCKSQPQHKTSTFRAVVEQLRWFAGVQVCFSAADWHARAQALALPARSTQLTASSRAAI